MLHTRLADILNKGFWIALDWIYPPICAGCGEPGYRLCEDCQAKINFISGNRCEICGGRVNRSAPVCTICQTNLPPYQAMRNLANYGGIIRECIHALKYQNNQNLSELFSGWLEEIVRGEGWEVDLVIPVPLSANRMKERGYNQSARIARPLARRLSVHYNSFGLERIRDTRSQVGLSAEDRHHNVAGAFKGISEIVAGKSVLLIDDVMTTGSTLEACTLALFEASARTVYCLTIARYSKRMSQGNLIQYQV